MPEKMSEALVDRFGRQVDYARISVTDRCDFRCVYCMPEDARFVARAEILALEELLALGQAFVALGVRRIRVTGPDAAWWRMCTFQNPTNISRCTAFFCSGSMAPPLVTITINDSRNTVEMLSENRNGSSQLPKILRGSSR